MLRWINNLNTNIKLAFGAILLISFIALLSFQFVYIRTLNADIDDEIRQLRQDEQTLHDLQEIQKNAAIYKERLYKLKIKVPDAIGEEIILSSLQDTSTFSSNNFTQITFGSGAQQESYTQVPLKISFTGNYDSFVELLNKLKSGTRLIQIDNVTITSGEKGISAEVSAQAFTTEVAPKPSNEKDVKKKKGKN